MPLIIELEHEFSERNGNHFVWIDSRRRKLFATGGVWDMTLSRGLEPPSQDLERLRARLRFHASVASLARQTFDSIKNRVLGFHVQGSVVWDSAQLSIEQNGDAEKDLLALQKLHSEHSGKVAELKAEIEKQPEVIKRRLDSERQRLYQEQEQRRQAAFRSKIEKITLDAGDVDAIAARMNGKHEGSVSVDTADTIQLD